MPLRADDWIILCLYSWDIDLSWQKRILACAAEDFMSIYPDQSLKEEFSNSSKLFYLYHWTPSTWVMWKMTFKTKSINMTFCTLPFSSGDVVRILIMQHFLAISLVIYHALTKKKKKTMLWNLYLQQWFIVLCKDAF